MLERKLACLGIQAIEVCWRKSEFLFVDRPAHLIGRHGELLNNCHRRWREL